MTTIGSQAYASNSALAYNRLATTPQPGAAKTAEDPAAQASGGAAVNVTLSDAAKAAMKAQAAPSADTIVSAARAAIDKLLSEAKATSALSDGRPTIDMGGLDRRSLFAVGANQGGGFTPEEQGLARYTLSTNFNNALAGPMSASRITGDYAAIYDAGLAYLDKAGPEEKASSGWAQQRDAMVEGRRQAASGGGIPAGIPGDPVAAYAQSLGGAAPTTVNRDILKVAGDVRAALDTQYAGGVDPDGAKLDLGALDDRALAAIVLNKGDQFSAKEIAAARTEMRQRTSTAVLSDAKSGELANDLITHYASMSDEERQAQGWTPDIYAKMLQTQQLSQQVASMGAGNPYAGGVGRLSSLLDYLT